MTDTEDYPERLRHALGAEIRSWRMSRELSRLALAERVGISETTMGRIERDGPVDVGDTWAIARALGVPLADMVRRAEEAAELAQRPSKYDRPNEGLPPEERALLLAQIDLEHGVVPENRDEGEDVDDGMWADVPSLGAVAQEGEIEGEGEQST